MKQVSTISRSPSVNGKPSWLQYHYSKWWHMVWRFSNRFHYSMYYFEVSLLCIFSLMMYSTVHGKFSREYQYMLFLHNWPSKGEVYCMITRGVNKELNGFRFIHTLRVIFPGWRIFLGWDREGVFTFQVVVRHLVTFILSNPCTRMEWITEIWLGQERYPGGISVSYRIQSYFTFPSKKRFLPVCGESALCDQCEVIWS